MFEKIKGSLESVGGDHIVIETPVFSYKVFVSLKTIERLPNQEEEIVLYLKPIFKENDITLYGFDRKEDRTVFTELMSVNKVGPKTALSLLSLYERIEIINIIAEGRVKDLTRATGLGKRGADLIIASLKDKYKKEAIITEESAVDRIRKKDEDFNEAVAALTSLGYTWEVASEAVSLAYTGDKSLEDLIKDALISMNS